MGSSSNEVGADVTVVIDGAIVPSSAVAGSEEIGADEVTTVVIVGDVVPSVDAVGLTETVGPVVDDATDDDAVGDADADAVATVGDVVVAATVAVSITGALVGAMDRHASWGTMKHDRAISSSARAQ
jgi:hypothetical protein